MKLHARVALVTGGARNIGRAIALRLAAEGARVLVTDVRDEEGSAVVAEIQLPGPTTGFPVTYTKAGRQYIAVAVRVDNAVEVVALAVPAATPPSGRGGRAGATP